MFNEKRKIKINKEMKETKLNRLVLCVYVYVYVEVYKINKLSSWKKKSFFYIFNVHGFTGALNFLNMIDLT